MSPLLFAMLFAAGPEWAIYGACLGLAAAVLLLFTLATHQRILSMIEQIPQRPRSVSSSTIDSLFRRQEIPFSPLLR